MFDDVDWRSTSTTTCNRQLVEPDHMTDFAGTATAWRETHERIAARLDGSEACDGCAFYARSPGSFWAAQSWFHVAFCRPLVFALPVLAMWSALRAPYERGMALMPFLWSGYLPLLMFRHVTGHAMNCIHNNAAVMYHRVDHAIR